MAPNQPAHRGLISPPGSKVSSAELLREVEEYFELGATVLPGATVLDVGANVGAFSLRVAEQCQGDVRIVCFEPSPETFGALQTNFETNPLLRSGRKHSIHMMGLTSKEQAGESISFYNFRRFPTNSTFDIAGKRREFEIFFEDRGRRVRERLAGIFPLFGRLLERLIAGLPKGRLGWWVSKQIMGLEEVRAELESLDNIIKQHELARIDLLKIDVEGSELAVLRGLGSESWPKVRQVVLETHNRDGRQVEIEALLRSNGLTDIRTAAQKTIDNGLDSLLLLASRPN
jgi:FkbM family methyltransferase